MPPSRDVFRIRRRDSVILMTKATLFLTDNSVALLRDHHGCPPCRAASWNPEDNSTSARLIVQTVQATAVTQ
jgi:hypothetical protein